ncbi:NAD+ diphosphatase [Fibrobacter sp. UWB15]|uniref:NAD(+) diphosphatase n=1 Tax=unclassified Fibrobacter TaxID=2634177 RepID=UPI0009234088|nr:MULTISPECIES: NAD(+) diphosphatase [unclassified Fibrobacter]PWJ62335.1 NAD+ diphosphatase [Fibrobacter sp. UWB6]SHG52421.1 NAD+ diphosphatase [Fibrobacter sp. UWB8]SMG40401.1 NAD+ diphosphatase [Fibrobacter sp. UWB15]
MIHEIAPHILNNDFKPRDPKSSDFLICYDGAKTLLKKSGEGYAIPRIGELLESQGKSLNDFEGHYLFSIDDTAFFLDDSLAGKTDSAASAATEGYEYMGNRTFRGMNPVERMGGATAAHIAHWESLNKFCGRCGNGTIRGDRERSIICPKCGNVVYPRISPVVIVAVRNGDKLLMAHNIDNPNPRLFLISGFVEIGESLEQAVHREVMEESGLRVKNIRYFGSQPWPFSDSLIAGFTAELDGDDTIHMQKEELSEAMWVKREDIPEYETDVSISCCLIENFRRGFTINP